MWGCADTSHISLSVEKIKIPPFLRRVIGAKIFLDHLELVCRDTRDFISFFFYLESIDDGYEKGEKVGRFYPGIGQGYGTGNSTPPMASSQSPPSPSSRKMEFFANSPCVTRGTCVSVPYSSAGFRWRSPARSDGSRFARFGP